MKTNKLLILLPILCLFLSSCLEMEETYNLNTDGSYSVNYNLDMGGLMGLVAGMLPDSVKDAKEFKAIKDTTVNLGTMPDSLKKNMKAEELALLQHTDMRMQMNLDESLLKIGFKNEGKSIKELDNFLSNFSGVMKKAKVADLMSKPLGASGAKASGSEDNKDMPFASKEFDYVITPNSFERKIKLEVLAAKKAKDEKVYAMIKSMDLKMTSTIIINLPKPASSVDNPNAVLSADKKQFKLVINMLEAINNPAMMNFKVNY